MKEKIKIISELSKIRITFFVMVTTGFGYIAAAEMFDLNFLLVLLGVLFLACGSASLNHYQERFTDALMERTRNRPIPSGRITSKSVLEISVLLILAGIVLLFIGGNILSVLFGILNLIWYNGIYTPLKRKTSLAIIPGSLVGAIPPVIGWVAADGNLFSPQILMISFFLFIWQIPHFWLLLLVLDGDYKKAGMPTLTGIFSKNQLARITFIWIIATAISSMFLPLVELVETEIVKYLIVFSVILLSINSIKLLKYSEEKNSIRYAFRNINFFVLFVISIISFDKLIL
ncbi:MAG: protoheme IX farnesyltransferase [Ignavibacterium album]|uniref:protoheme IX farnesyltransferase n=1 Tax=Ignavibacterium album TaxID=591197 RepID=UPI0026EBF3BE|nr:protoheme IX farnesyltransferase [Ignavibacterium album]MBI5660918.1 protoheme IX farnesyltransferase [Ignavibacterium album]